MGRNSSPALKRSSTSSTLATPKLTQGGRNDGECDGDACNDADGGVRRGKGAVSMTDLILWAIIESLRADGYEAEVKEVEQDAGSV